MLQLVGCLGHWPVGIPDGPSLSNLGRGNERVACHAAEQVPPQRTPRALLGLQSGHGVRECDPLACGPREKAAGVTVDESSV